MESGRLGTVEAPSEVHYSYAAVHITQSRIRKGLIALPRSLLHLFPKNDAVIQVYLGDADRPQPKKYSHFAGTTKESRIGGMARWFEEGGIGDRDELVIQLLDRERLIYRVSARREFIETVKRHQRGLERARTVAEARSHVSSLRRWVKPERGTVALSEFDRLAMQSSAGQRGLVSRPAHGTRESVPPPLRALLEEVYGGHCQVCDFTFLKQDKTPYFETHHLFAARGHHPKNVVVSCANCHRQFEYAATELQMDEQTWLTAVTFNTIRHSVFQAVLRAQLRPPIRQVHEI